MSYEFQADCVNEEKYNYGFTTLLRIAENRLCRLW